MRRLQNIINQVRYYFKKYGFVKTVKKVVNNTNDEILKKIISLIEGEV